MQRALMLLLVSGFVSATALAQDPVKVAATQCKVAFENEYVRVLHWTISPHEKTSVHEHPAMVTVSLSSGTTRFTTPDGKSRDVESKARQATWSAPETHFGENLSDKKSEVIQVELKKRPDAGMTALSAAEDSVKVDPRHYRSEFQNDRVRVVRIRYGTGEKSVMHAHPASVAIYLTDGQAKMTLADGQTNSQSMKAGQVQWTDPGKHLPENTSGKPFELVLVELR